METTDVLLKVARTVTNMPFSTWIKQPEVRSRLRKLAAVEPASPAAQSIKPPAMTKAVSDLVTKRLVYGALGGAGLGGLYSFMTPKHGKSLSRYLSNMLLGGTLGGLGGYGYGMLGKEKKEDPREIARVKDIADTEREMRAATGSFETALGGRHPTLSKEEITDNVRRLYALNKYVRAGGDAGNVSEDELIELAGTPDSLFPAKVQAVNDNLLSPSNVGAKWHRYQDFMTHLPVIGHAARLVQGDPSLGRPQTRENREATLDGLIYRMINRLGLNVTPEDIKTQAPSLWKSLEGKYPLEYFGAPDNSLDAWKRRG